MRMALPLANERRGLPLTLAFLASSMVIALSVGFGLGSWLLLHTTFGIPVPAGGWVALVQVHGHAQLVGFAGLLVMGIGYRILPRFRGAAEPAGFLMAASWALVAGGVILRSAQIFPDLAGRDLILLASGMLTIAGTLIYALTAIDVLAGGTSPHRADEVVIGAAIVWLPVGALWSFVSLTPVLAGATGADPVAGSAAVWALLLGAIGGHILGVSLRVAPAFIAAPLARDRSVVAGAVVWNAGVFAATLSLSAAPPLLLAGALLLVHAIGPFRRGNALREIPPPARVTRLAFRAGYAWLLIGLVLLALATLPPGPIVGATSAARHALALGFLMSIVFGVGARLIPALTGGIALPLGAVASALALTNAAALLRVVFELIGPVTALASAALAVSGLLAYAALLVFAAAAARSVLSVTRPA
jgi:uncharacterized protein involved in response to NO